MADSIFTKIINREIPADIVYEDEQYIAIKDINPQAPVHNLIITKKPIENIGAMTEADKELIGGLFYTAKKVADQEGLTDYRIRANTGTGAGQTVFHLHIHLLGGKSFTESDL